MPQGKWGILCRGAAQWSWYLRDAGFVGACGRFGIEYDFWFPLQISIDWRPTLGVNLFNTQEGLRAGFGYDLYCGGLGLGIRYKF